MASRSSLDSRVQESPLLERLGPPTGPPLVFGPKPLRLDPGSILLSGAALGLLGTSLRIAFSSRGFAFILAYGLATAALAAGPAAFLVLRRSRRIALAPFERGVVIETPARKLTFLLAELRSLELSERDTGRGLLRRIALTGHQGTRVGFEHFARHGKEDRLGAVLIHLLARLVEIGERRIGGGGTVSGWDWVLGPGGLSAPAGDPPVPLAEIGEVTVREGKVSLRRPGERYPFFVIPAGTANALLLVGLLGRRLEERG